MVAAPPTMTAAAEVPTAILARTARASGMVLLFREGSLAGPTVVVWMWTGHRRGDRLGNGFREISG
jgi:hypothetical protein